ncbi:hypothetical protein TCAL_02398, partial [Tigriopus californicus]
ENLDLVSQRLVTLAKDNGSTDNITIIVVLLKPAAELASRDEPDAASSKSATSEIYQGVSSTCAFISNRQDPYQSMDKSTEDLASPAVGNPFATPMDSEMNTNGSSQNNHFFDSPSGGGMFSDSPNPFAEAGAKFSNEDMEALAKDMHFERASPSMFDQSLDSDSSRPSEDTNPSKNTDHNDEPDFMANQENAWINHGHPYLAGQHKRDSGFISPAGTSNNHSASSEDSAENHAEREHSPESEEGHHSVEVKDTLDEEEAESMEVTKLLASAGGAKLDELLKSSREETPTPPIEDNDSTLEDILAQAREQPASLTSEVLDEDEDSSSEGEHQEPPTSRPPDAPKEELIELPTVEDDSSSEDNGEGFTFVKETSSEKDPTSLGSEEDLPPPSVEAPQRPLEDNLDPFSVPQTNTVEEQATSFDLLGSADNPSIDSEPVDNPFAPSPASDPPSVEEVATEVAASTLNALEEDSQPSGPSSLESQTGPSSVIVESQEVPNPDQASFIVKTTDDLISAQEPVVEVIPSETLGNQSPILEEQEEPQIMASTISESMNSFEAPRTSQDMFDEAHNGGVGHGHENDSNVVFHEEENQSLSSDFVLKTNSGDFDSKSEHKDESPMSSIGQSDIPTLVVTESTPQKRDFDDEEDEAEEQQKQTDIVEETPEKEPEIQKFQIEENPPTPDMEPPAAVDFPILEKTVSTEAVHDEPLVTEVKHFETREPVEEPMMVEKHIEPLCDPCENASNSTENVVIKTEPMEVEGQESALAEAPVDAEPPILAEAPAETIEKVDEDTNAAEIAVAAAAAGTALVGLAAGAAILSKDKDEKAKDAGKKTGDPKPKSKANPPLRQPNSRSPLASKSSTAKNASTAITRPGSATTKPASTRPTASTGAPKSTVGAKRPVGTTVPKSTTARPTPASTVSKSAAPKRPTPGATSTRPASATSSRPGSAPKPTVSRVTPGARPTPASTTRKPLTSKPSPAGTATKAPAAPRTSTTRPTPNGTASSRVGSTRPTGTTAPSGVKKPLANGVAKPAAPKSTMSAARTASSARPGSASSTTGPKPIAKAPISRPAPSSRVPPKTTTTASRTSAGPAKAGPTARPTSASTARPGISRPGSKAVPKLTGVTSKVNSRPTSNGIKKDAKKSPEKATTAPEESQVNNEIEATNGESPNADDSAPVENGDAAPANPAAVPSEPVPIESDL